MNLIGQRLDVLESGIAEGPILSEEKEKGDGGRVFIPKWVQKCIILHIILKSRVAG